MSIREAFPLVLDVESAFFAYQSSAAVVRH